MDYWFEKFAGVSLPDNPRVDAGTGDTRMAILQLPGGGIYDPDGDGLAPRALARVSMSGVVHASCPADLRERCNELRALRGVRGALYRRHLDGRREWITARCMEVAAIWTTTSRRHAEVELSWVLEGTHWEGDAHDITTTLNTSPKTVTLANGGNLAIADAIITVTAQGSAITQVSIAISGVSEVQWAGTLAVGKSLLIHCGAQSVHNDGTDAYSGLTLTSNHKISDWLRLEPGDNSVVLTRTGGDGTSSVRFQYSDGWA